MAENTENIESAESTENTENTEAQQEKQFVRRTMCAKCQYGNMDFQYLNLPRDHGVYFQNVDQPLMNANDHVSGKHILQFGRCTAPGNPGNLLDTLVSASSNPILKWIDKTVDGIQEALGCEGCKCHPMILSSWQMGDEANRLDGAPAITSESSLHCVYGGLITITQPPQDDDEKKKQNQDEENKKKEQKEKDIMDTIPAAMKGKINKKNEKAIEEYNAAIEAIDAAVAEANMEGNSEMQSEAEIDLSMIPEDVLAMLTDTELWYKENPLEFVENNRVSEQIIEQNYIHNRTQIIDPACLNDEGFITDSSLLYNYNMASSNVSQIGQSCAASYNLMRLIDDTIYLQDIIHDMEMMQTYPGYMDNGPLPITMLCMGEMMEERGLPTLYGYGDNALATWNNMGYGDIGVWGFVEAGEPNFYTFVTDEQGCKKCLEQPEWNMEEWSYRINDTQNMFIRVQGIEGFERSKGGKGKRR